MSYGYLLKEVIGQGSYGVVILAQDTQFDRLVALKFSSSLQRPELALKEFSMLRLAERAPSVIKAYCLME